MAGDFADQLKEEARPFLEQGEEIVASIVAQPRGTSNSKIGGVAPPGDRQRLGRQVEARRRGRRAGADEADGARAPATGA